MISHGTQVPHRGIEPLALSIGPSRIPDTILIPDNADSAFTASPEEVRRTLRLAAADRVKDIEASFVPAKLIAERQEFHGTSMDRTPVVQNTSKTDGNSIRIVPAMDQAVLFEDLPAFRKFNQRSNSLADLPWD
jgi:hypothetical protein